MGLVLRCGNEYLHDAEHLVGVVVLGYEDDALSSASAQNASTRERCRGTMKPTEAPPSTQSASARVSLPPS